MYFLPADGGEKVIKIRRFSNETAIATAFEKNKFIHSVSPYHRPCLKTVEILSFPPRRRRGGKILSTNLTHSPP
ncbi:MAG: hypothetical protein LBR79_03130 [Oscillospiraceae bacterium]|nr:hypothetical protein [Oscillospiraceae bacterium]